MLNFFNLLFLQKEKQGKMAKRMLKFNLLYFVTNLSLMSFVCYLFKVEPQFIEWIFLVELKVGYIKTCFHNKEINIKVYVLDILFILLF